MGREYTVYIYIYIPVSSPPPWLFFYRQVNKRTRTTHKKKTSIRFFLLVNFGHTEKFNCGQFFFASVTTRRGRGGIFFKKIFFFWNTQSSTTRKQKKKSFFFCFFFLMLFALFCCVPNPSHREICKTQHFIFLWEPKKLFFLKPLFANVVHTNIYITLRLHLHKYPFYQCGTWVFVNNH